MPDSDSGAEEDEGPKVSSKLEWRFAQMENRLRETIVELSTPTVQRATVQGAEIENMRAVVNEHTKKINDMFQLRNKVIEVTTQLEMFRDEMQKNEGNTHQALIKAQEDVRLARVDLEVLLKSSEQKESAVHHLQRSLERAGTEINWIQGQIRDQDEHAGQRLEEHVRKASARAAQLEAQIKAQELRHHSLTDELWGEETGLARCSGELVKTNEALTKLEEQVRKVEGSLIDPRSLTEIRTEVSKWLQTADCDMSELKHRVGNVVADVRDELRTAVEVSATQTVAIIAEVRKSYQEELDRVSVLKQEISTFQLMVDNRIGETDKRVAAVAEQSEVLMAENKEAFEEADKKRKRDRAAGDIEVKGLKKRLGGVFESTDVVSRGLEYISDVVGVLLKAVSMQCSLDSQDAKDRESIFLMGVREAPDSKAFKVQDVTQSPGRPQPKPSPRIQKCGSRWASPKRGSQQVVSVEQRCLSCSHQAPTVLSAFKMACLQYSPSPVFFEDREHDRSDLLQCMEEAIGQACALYITGGVVLERTGQVKPPKHGESTTNLQPTPVPLGEYAGHGGSTVRLPSVSARPSAMGPATPRLKSESMTVLQ